jgi:DNA helicase II / ATP-dependent DNA helicase PcrA
MPSDLATGHAAEIEEERRLFYVGMTRAKRHLHLMVPQRYYVRQQAALGDVHVYGSLTRFIPPALHHHFERLGPSAAAAAPVAATPAGAKVDLHARVRALF